LDCSVFWSRPSQRTHRPMNPASTIPLMKHNAKIVAIAWTIPENGRIVGMPAPSRTSPTIPTTSKWMRHRSWDRMAIIPLPLKPAVNRHAKRIAMNRTSWPVETDAIAGMPAMRLMVVRILVRAAAISPLSRPYPMKPR